MKNYKELCKLLEVEERKGGRNKQYHHEDFERHFEYHKEGHKYIIDNIYLEPIDKVDTREIYSNLIKQLILNRLAQEHKRGNKNILLSAYQLFENLYMVNNNYNQYNNDRLNLSKKLDIDISYVNDFYLSTYGKLSSSLKSALKSLDNKGIIVFKEEYLINTTFDGKDFSKIMNDGEIELYNKFVGEYISEHETTKSKIAFTGKWREYNNYIVDNMSEYFQHEINYIYKAYKVYFNDNYIKELDTINEYLSINHNEVGMVLNQTIVDKYKLSYINRYDNYIDKYNGMCEMEIVNMKKYEYNDMIIHIGKEYGSKLIDYTINRKRNREIV